MGTPKLSDRDSAHGRAEPHGAADSYFDSDSDEHAYTDGDGDSHTDFDDALGDPEPNADQTF